MTDDKIVTVLITKDGNMTVDTENYKGEACVEAVKKLLDTFFDVDQNIEHKSDFYEKDEDLNLEVGINL